MYVPYTIFIMHYSVEIVEESVTFTIPGSSVEDSGTYTVKATNEYGVSECSAEVTLEYAAPSFIQPLKDTPAVVNQSATFTCQVTGQPEPTTKWQISGMDLFESEKYHSECTAEGHYQLTINDITIDDTEMSYTCKATNPAGTNESTAHLLQQGWYACKRSVDYYPGVIMPHVSPSQA